MKGIAVALQKVFDTCLDIMCAHEKEEDREFSDYIETSTRDEENLVTHLQEIYENLHPSRWPSEFRNVANQYGVTYQ